MSCSALTHGNVTAACGSRHRSFICEIFSLGLTYVVVSMHVCMLLPRQAVLKSPKAQHAGAGSDGQTESSSPWCHCCEDATAAGGPTARGLSLELVGVFSEDRIENDRHLDRNNLTVTCRVVAVAGWRPHLDNNAIQPISPKPALWEKMVSTRLRDARRSSMQVGGASRP